MKINITKEIQAAKDNFAPISSIVLSGLTQSILENANITLEKLIEDNMNKNEECILDIHITANKIKLALKDVIIGWSSNVNMLIINKAKELLRTSYLTPLNDLEDTIENFKLSLIDKTEEFGKDWNQNTDHSVKAEPSKHLLQCNWAYKDGYHVPDCGGESLHFKHYIMSDFNFCPFCGRKIKLPTNISELISKEK